MNGLQRGTERFLITGKKNHVVHRVLVTMHAYVNIVSL